jgi:hypothetical protein
MAPPGTLYLGATRRLDGGGTAAPLYLPTHHLVTHGVVVGMTMPVTYCPAFSSA